MYVCIQYPHVIARFYMLLNARDMHVPPGKYASALRDINSIRNVRMSQYGREAGKHPRAGIGMSRRHNL